jgi:hypothetical protein
MDQNWDKDNFDNGDLSKPVIAIHACGYVNENNLGDEDGNPPTNHWAMFLELPGLQSVGLDMIPGYGSDGLRGKLEIASKKYQLTENAIRTISFPVAQGITVQRIVDVIATNKRQKYNFTEEMEGCRFWVYTIISDFEGAGIVDHGSGASALDAVSQYWRNPEGHEAREVKQGHFRA